MTLYRHKAGGSCDKKIAGARDDAVTELGLPGVWWAPPDGAAPLNFVIRLGR